MTSGTIHGIWILTPLFPLMLWRSAGRGVSQRLVPPCYLPPLRGNHSRACAIQLLRYALACQARQATVNDEGNAHVWSVDGMTGGETTRPLCEGGNIMTNSSISKQSLAGLAILVLAAGCAPDQGGGPTTNATPNATAANPALANDFGGSGVVLNTSIAAPFVLFQNDSVSRLVNRDGGAVKPDGVNNIYSLGAYVDPNDSNRVKLFVNDRLNHRVLIFNTIPQDATALPDVVLGQADFVSGTPNAGVGTSAVGFNENVHMSVCSNGKMFVSDRNNNRVLVYDRVPTANGTAADFV